MAVRKLLRMQESDIYRKGIFSNPRTSLDQTYFCAVELCCND